MSLNIKILLATHKEAHIPKGNIYFPIHVGKEGKKELGYQGDNSGDNISIKNPYYSELTAIFWAWKNLNADYIGLVHYRRLFSLKRKESLYSSILNDKEALALCNEHSIILPAKRNYMIESLYSHYAHTHDSKHLDLMRNIIRQKQPDYLSSYDKIMNRRWGHLFNMFIMKKDFFDNYCLWLFPLLFELEGQIDFNSMSAFDARVMGRVSEFLLDVWIEKNNLSYKEINWVQFGKKNLVKKIQVFLAAKFLNKKYNQSQ